MLFFSLSLSHLILSYLTFTSELILLFYQPFSLRNPYPNYCNPKTMEFYSMCLSLLTFATLFWFSDVRICTALLLFSPFRFTYLFLRNSVSLFFFSELYILSRNSFLKKKKSRNIVQIKPLVGTLSHLPKKRRGVGGVGGGEGVVHHYLYLEWNNLIHQNNIWQSHSFLRNPKGWSVWVCIERQLTWYSRVIELSGFDNKLLKG